MTSGLKQLTTHNFGRAFNLLTLKLNGNRLQSIRRNVFSANATTLRRLDEDSETIYPLHKLYRLLLHQNEISVIEDNAFVGLQKLYDLDLSYNRLKTIGQQTFAGLSSLSILGLGHNQIETIEDGVFDLSALEILFLRKNKLKRLSDAVFSRSTSLHSLFLDENQLERIGRSLYRLPNIIYISLMGNRIEDIDLDGFASLTHLDKLTLTRSGFNFKTTNFGRSSLSASGSPLTELEIDGNDLTDETELEQLRMFTNLEILNLDGNLFTDFELRGHRSLKDILPALKIVYLRGNEIDCIDVTSLTHELKSKRVNVVQDCMH